MDWKIEIELLFVSPFLLMALLFGIAETVEIIITLRAECRR